MRNRKKLETEIGLTAQSTSSEIAHIDKSRCYNKRSSPVLSEMKSEKINSRTYVFGKTDELLQATINAIEII